MAWKRYLVTKTGAPGTATAGSIVEAEESTQGDAVCRLIVGERYRMNSDGGLFFVKFKYLQEIDNELV